MRNFILFLFFYSMTAVGVSQQRYLVTPANEAIALKPHESAREVMNALMASPPKDHFHNTSPSGVGYPPVTFPVTDTIGAYHKDVLAMWFVAPATGTLDTIYWQSGSQIGAYDSVIFARADTSHIGPSSGPGFGYSNACFGWGYYLNAFDLDMGITPDLDFATNPTWQVHPSYSSSPPTFPPAGGSIIFPGMYGYAIIDRPNRVNEWDLSMLGGPFMIHSCDTIWISMRIHSSFSTAIDHLSYVPTQFTACSTNAPYPSRVWKFFEHGYGSPYGPPSASAVCDTSPVGGWYPYSGPDHDSTKGLVLNWWFVMTVDTTVPKCNLASFQVQMNTPWNLVSSPTSVPDNHASALFPSAISNAYAYNGGTYVPSDTIGKRKGYWLKFDPPQSVRRSGSFLLPDTFQLSSGWNLVGSTGVSTPVSNISSIPPGIVTSQFFGYNGGYSASLTIDPGKGYWVKANSPGKIILSGAGAADPLSRVRIVPSEEAPPSAPDESNIQHPTSNIPTEYALEQNYPNPFNPATTISFALPSRSFVSLKVFDPLGREVAVLLAGELPAGTYSTRWNAEGRSSGVYLFRLQAGSFTETKKLILLK